MSENNKSSQLTPLDRVLSPALNLHPPNTPPSLYPSALSHFTSIPWCADLLLSENSPYGTGPSIPFIPQCFNPVSPQHDQFVGATLASERGLKHVLSFFRPDDETHLRDPARPITRVDTLFAVGEGLSGYHNIIHGGMTMTMVDESMGTVNEINTALGKDGLVHKLSSVTASLDIRFLQPVPVPGVVWVTSWTENIQGRKTRMRCEVKDGQGAVLAKAASTWVALKPNL
ncbi:thioesterase family protein, partial [Metarhizium majus ARSEF 297]